MLNWKKIEDLNLKEVAARTKIELDFLEALIKKDFSKLNRFNVRGFTKILSREYELDFSDFYEEFELYLNENKLNNTIKAKMIAPKLDAYTQKSNNFIVFIVIVILCIFVAGIYYFDTIKTLFNDENNNSSNTVVNIIGQAQDNMKALGNNIIIIDNQKQEDESGQDEEILDIVQEDDYFKENNLSEIMDENIQKDVQELRQDALFKVSDRIWVGLIDLQSYKKTSFTKEEDFNVSLQKDQLILTGAAALSVFNEDNIEQKFPAGNSKRFLIKDGRIMSISMEEFMRLNRGRAW